MSIARKIKRKQSLQARKSFMKQFKKTMKEYRDRVQCSFCGYHPLPGENIDEWMITEKKGEITLKCLNCIDGTEEEETNVKN